MWPGAARVGRRSDLSEYCQECNLYSSSGRAEGADYRARERARLCVNNAAPVCSGPSFRREQQGKILYSLSSLNLSPAGRCLMFGSSVGVLIHEAPVDRCSLQNGRDGGAHGPARVRWVITENGQYSCATRFVFQRTRV